MLLVMEKCFTIFLVVCFINFSDFENVSSNDIGPLLKLNALSIPLSFKSFSSTSTDPPIK